MTKIVLSEKECLHISIVFLCEVSHLVMSIVYGSYPFLDTIFLPLKKF